MVQQLQVVPLLVHIEPLLVLLFQHLGSPDDLAKGLVVLKQYDPLFELGIVELRLHVVDVCPQLVVGILHWIVFDSCHERRGTHY